jgi:hypothetical protein
MPASGAADDPAPGTAVPISCRPTLAEENEIRIVVAEDSQAGVELWSQLERDLALLGGPA